MAHVPRKKNVFAIVSDTIPEDVSSNDDGLGNLTAAEILQLIIRLPVGYRTVFNLHAIEGIETPGNSGTAGHFSRHFQITIK